LPERTTGEGRGSLNRMTRCLSRFESAAQAKGGTRWFSAAFLSHSLGAPPQLDVKTKRTDD
jgi:hypothetical protein